MALITRQSKGSKLTKEEMDANLLYLQSIAAGSSASLKFITAADCTETWELPGEVTAKIYTVLDSDDSIYITATGEDDLVFAQLPEFTSNKKVSIQFSSVVFLIKTKLSIISNNDIQTVGDEYLTGDDSNFGGLIEAYYEASSKTWNIVVTSHTGSSSSATKVQS